MTRLMGWMRYLGQFTCMLLTLLGDGVYYFRLRLRSRTALAAENLFLRKQLALYQERSITPRRATHATCNELITSVALLDNIAWVLLTLGENETNLLLGLPENELTIVEKSLQTSGSAHIA